MMLVFPGTHEVAQCIEIGLLTFVKHVTGQQSVHDPLRFGKVLPFGPDLMAGRRNARIGYGWVV